MAYNSNGLHALCFEPTKPLQRTNLKLKASQISQVVRQGAAQAPKRVSVALEKVTLYSLPLPQVRVEERVS